MSSKYEDDKDERDDDDDCEDAHSHGHHGGSHHEEDDHDEGGHDEEGDTECPCFAEGTLLSLKSGGVVAVEDIRAGDDLMTVSGTNGEVLWIERL
jgi:hypothetical protein